MAVPFWKRQRYRLEAFGLMILGTLVCALPYPWLAPLARFMGSAVWFFDWHRRRVTLANLRCAFGERFTEREILALGRKSYGVFARSMLELLWSPNLADETVLPRICSQVDLDPSATHDRPGRAVIYTCLHAGNYEWTSNISKARFGPVPLIAQEFKNPLLGPLFDSWRTTVGHTIFPKKGAMLRTLRHLKDAGKMGMLVDLNLKPSEGPVLIRCFGKYLTPVTRLPAELAMRTGAAVVPVEILPRPEGGHVLRYHPEIPITPSLTAGEIAQACWDVLEPGLRAHPELWLWSYKHWRYRPEGAEGDAYPFYANPDQGFQRLLAEQEIPASRPVEN
jgi:lauroyl/myristoyl acyltransferase